MKLLIACTVMVFAASAARAQVLLNIDITGPNTMVITATGQGPVTSDSSQSYFEGIDLEGLFKPNEDAFNFDGTVVLTSTLTAGTASSGPVYNLASVDSLSESNADLNLSTGDGTAQNFAFGQAAFTSDTSLTVGFSGLTFSGIDYGVVVAGNSNLIVSFDSSSTNGATPIGVYHVTSIATPEPSTYAMMLGGLTVLGFCVRRKLA